MHAHTHPRGDLTLILTPKLKIAFVHVDMGNVPTRKEEPTYTYNILPLQCHHQTAAKSRDSSQWRCSVLGLDH